MAGYQFFHVEGYARKAGKGKAGGHTISSILGEADREPGACPHVQNPVAPVVLFGHPPALVAAEAIVWANHAKDLRGHALRQDGLCMAGGVISVPQELKDWEGFKQASTAFLVREFGDRLRSVIEHTDEKERHLHFYAIPLPGERFEVLHRGRAAAARAKAQEKPKGIQNAEYKSAMRKWQDQFWLEVSSRFALARIGPGRRRLTREEWKAEQEQNKLVAKTQRENKLLQGLVNSQEKQLRRYQLDPEKNPLMKLKKNLLGPEKKNQIRPDQEESKPKFSAPK
jgi:hypothetical protein